ELVELHQGLAEQHDVYTSNETFKAYVAELAAGYGLTGVAPAVTEAALNTQPTDPTEIETSNPLLEQVKGQEMVEVTSAEPEETEQWWLLGLFFVISLGAVYQAFMWRRQHASIGE